MMLLLKNEVNCHMGSPTTGQQSQQRQKEPRLVLVFRPPFSGEIEICGSRCSRWVLNENRDPGRKNVFWY